MPDKTYTKSVEGICTLFWDLERDLGLLRASENGIYYWRLIRFQLYYDLVQHLGIFDAPHPAQKKDIKDLWTDAQRFWKHAVLNNPTLSRKKYSAAVFPHTRQVKGVDIYTEDLLKHLPEQDRILIYRARHGDYYDGSYLYMIAPLIDRLRIKLQGQKALSNDTAAVLGKVEDAIKLSFGATYDLKKRALFQINKFRFECDSYKRLFNNLGIRQVYMVVAYTQMAAVHAAQALGIAVTELQHGTMTRYHLGYSFPVDSEHVPYAPNRLLCFGQFWSDHTPLPAQTKTAIIGAPYIERIIAGNQSLDKIPKTIAFASQGVIGEKLFAFAVECARRLPDYRFIFRLHPSEKMDIYEARLKEYAAPSNLELSGKTPDIFHLLKETDIHAGVFSTTLMEGMVLGCKTIVVTMQGVEYMKPVIENNDALQITTVDEFVAAIPKAFTCPNPRYYYEKIDGKIWEKLDLQ